MGILDKIPPEVWDKIFDLLFKMLENIQCRRSSMSEVVGQFRNPGRSVKWRFERTLRREGIELTPEQLEEVYRTAAMVSQLDLEQFVQEAWNMF
mgnify:CR=1 FL=1